MTDETWVDLANLFLNERKQTHRNRQWMILFAGHSRIDTRICGDSSQNSSCFEGGRAAREGWRKRWCEGNAVYLDLPSSRLTERYT